MWGAFVVFVIVPLALGALGYCTRFVLRHLYRDYREKRIGALRWSRISQESRSTGAFADRFDGDDFAALMTFVNTIRSGRWPYPYMNRGVASFVWMRSAETGMIDLFVGVDDSHYGDGSAVRSLATSLGSSMTELQYSPDFPNKAITVATRALAIPSSAKGSVERHGPVASQLSSIWEGLRKGDSAAVTFTIDMMQNSESKRWESNFTEEAIMRSGAAAQFSSSTSPQAQLMAHNAVRCSIASANNTGDMDHSFAALNAALGGMSSSGWKYDMTNPSRGHRRMAIFISGLVTVITVLGAVVFGSIVSAIVAGLTAAALGTIIAKPDYLIDRWIQSRLARGEIVVPEYIWLSLRWRIHGMIRSGRRDAGGDTKVGNRVAPPSCKQVVTLHPAALYEAVSSPRGSVSGNTDVTTSGTQEIGLPANLVDVQNGIWIGVDGKTNLVFLDLRDIMYSLFTAGAPSSGKSNFLLVIFAGIVKACMNMTAGLQITPIWGETKGEGAYDAWNSARHHPKAIFVDVHNPRGYYRMALEGPRISDGASAELVVANCTKVTSSFQAAFGDGVRSASREVLDHVLRVSMLLNADEIAHLELDGMVNAQKPNIMDLSFFLLGGDNRVDPTSKLLAMSQEMKPQDAREEELVKSLGTLSRSIAKSSPRATMSAPVSSVLNKLSEMRNAPMVWEPDRRTDVYVGQLVNRFAPVVVNMGSFYDAKDDKFNQSVDQAVSQRLIRSFNYLLWVHIKSNCNNWQAEGKRIPMFFDEVKDIADNAAGGDVPNTLEEATKEGRSRGASYFLGAQYPSQMPSAVAHPVLGSRSKFWFPMYNALDLPVAVSDLTSGDRNQESISQGNIRSLSNGTALGYTTRDGLVTPAFTLHVPEQRLWIKHLFATDDIGEAISGYQHEKAAKDADAAEKEFYASR